MRSSSSLEDAVGYVVDLRNHDAVSGALVVGHHRRRAHGHIGRPRPAACQRPL